MPKKSQKAALQKIGEIITKKRNEKGYSRLKLAIELNTDEKQLRRIENGEHNYGVLTLLKIFGFLEIDSSVLDKIKNDPSIMND